MPDPIRMDPARITGFGRLSADSQRLVRDLIANPDSIAGLDVQARAGTDAMDAAAVTAALRFVAAHQGELLGSVATPEGGGWSPGTPLPGVQTTPAIEAKLQRMSLREKAQMLFMEYGSTRYQPKSGAMIVNQTHLKAGAVDQMKQLAQAYEARRDVTLLIAADQEGGKVNRLKRMPGYADVTFPSAEAIGAMTLDQIRAEGEKTGRGLRDAGVNLLLGPVLDVADPGSLMERMDRAFGSTPDDVIAKAGAFIEGILSANPNVAIIAKHFPGYNVRNNSDITPTTDSSSREQIERRARPFFEIDGLDGVMLSSIRYENIDPKPACFSSIIIDMIRAQKPNAVIITDDLYAGSLLPKEIRAFKDYNIYKARSSRSQSSRDEAARLLRRYPHFEDSQARQRLHDETNVQLQKNARQAFLAGADVLLVMDSRKSRLMTDAILGLAQSSDEHARRLDESVRRLLLLRKKIAAQPGIG